MRVATASLGLGCAFGFALSWTQMTDPDQIRRMLLLEDAYYFLVFATGVPAAAIGIRLLRRGASGDRIERRHVTGSIVFGAGWGISSSCPGPIAAQLGEGTVWAAATVVGIFVGLWLYEARAASLSRLQSPRPPRRRPRARASSSRGRAWAGSASARRSSR